MTNAVRNYLKLVAGLRKLAWSRYLVVGAIVFAAIILTIGLLYSGYNTACAIERIVTSNCNAIRAFFPLPPAKGDDWWAVGVDYEGMSRWLDVSKVIEVLDAAESHAFLPVDWLCLLEKLRICNQQGGEHGKIRDLILDDEVLAKLRERSKHKELGRGVKFRV